MRRFISLVVMVLVLGGGSLWAEDTEERTVPFVPLPEAQRGKRIIKAERFDVSPPLAEINQADRSIVREKRLNREIAKVEGANQLPSDWNGVRSTRVNPPVVQDWFAETEGILATPAPSVNVNGLGHCFPAGCATNVPADCETDADCFFPGSLPPDTQGCIGSNYYIQWINTSYAFFDKTTGAIVDLTGLDWRTGDTLWSGFGGACEYTNDGDPIIVYDQMARRWVMTQFAGINAGTPYQCFAVSVTGDPLGSWYRYAFSWGDRMNDYPKLAVWSDAYYLTVREFNLEGTGFYGSSVTAFDRNAMLEGRWPEALTTGPLQDPPVYYDNLLPADVDGDPPPYGSPNYIIASNGDAGSGTDLLMWKFHVDWTDLANSTFGLANDWIHPNATIDIADWTDHTEVAQPGTTQTLDNMPGQVMHRLAYRNFGSHESLVTNLTVYEGSGNPATKRNAIQWVEIRDPNGTPAVYQDSVFTPDRTDRWMGSIAMDGAGNIAVGYSVADQDDSTVYPGIRYTSRLATAAPGIMDTEVTAKEGFDTQSYTGANRWGDYSSMTVDPDDDMTFWYTNEYIDYPDPTYEWNWQTRITSFKYACSASAPGTPTSVSATASGDKQITVSWTAPGSGADRYRVLRAENAGGPYGPACVSTGTSCVDQYVEVDKTYYYVVKSYKANNCWSGASSEVLATPYGDCVDAPYFFGIDRVMPMAGTCALRVEWTAGESDCGGELLYNVYRDTSSGFTPSASNLAGSCVTEDFWIDDGPLTPGTKYYYVVRGEDPTSGHGGLCHGGNEDTNTWEYWNVPPDGNDAALLTEDFDSVAVGEWPTGWGYGGFGGFDAWLGAQACGTPPSGTQALRWGGSGACSTTYSRGAGSIAFPAVDIPAGIDNLKLSFAHSWDFTTGDGANLWVSYDGKMSGGAFPSFWWVDLETTVDPTTYLLSGAPYSGTTGGNGSWDGTQAAWLTSEVDLSSFCDSLSAEGFPANCADSILYVGFVGAAAGLYDRTDFISAGAPAQDFEAAYDAYDSRGADDFTVTGLGGWTVTEVAISGSYSAAGGPSSLDVWIMSDSGGKPGATVCTNTAIPPSSFVDNNGDYLITLPAPCSLSIGTYWLAFHANLDYGGGGGQYYWSARNDTIDGNEGVWQGRSGWGVPAACNCGSTAIHSCTVWGYTGTDCEVGGGSAANPLDWTFGIYGYRGSGAAPTNTGWLVDDVNVSWDTGAACNSSNDPPPLQFFTTTSKSGQNVLEWQNPKTDNYAATVIRFSTTSYPDSLTDGTEIYNAGTGGSGGYATYTHGSLTNGTHYYYTAWVRSPSGDYSGPMIVPGRPDDTTGPTKWVFNTGATALTPPGIGSVFASSNDRAVHSMDSGAAGGTWPTSGGTWYPRSMGRPAQGRPTVAPLSGGKIVLQGSQDGYVYKRNGVTGANLWSVQPAGASSMVQASPAALFTEYGGAADLVLVGTRTSGVDNTFYGLNLATGSSTVNGWSFDNGGGAAGIGIISADAWVQYGSPDKVYFTSRARSGGSAGTLWCLEITQTTASLCGGTWPVTGLGDIDSAPVVRGGTLYVGNNLGTIYAIDAATGGTSWTYATGDGPVKGFIWPDAATDDLYFSTTNRVWSLEDAGSHFRWSRTGIATPSAPVLVTSNSYLVVGSGDGKLFQLQMATGANTGTGGWPLTLGDGLAAAGSPALDASTNITYVGTESGAVYSVVLQ